MHRPEILKKALVIQKILLGDRYEDIFRNDYLNWLPQYEDELKIVTNAYKKFYIDILSLSILQGLQLGFVAIEDIGNNFAKVYDPEIFAVLYDKTYNFFIRYLSSNKISLYDYQPETMNKRTFVEFLYSRYSTYTKESLFAYLTVKIYSDGDEEGEKRYFNFLKDYIFCSVKQNPDVEENYLVMIPSDDTINRVSTEKIVLTLIQKSENLINVIAKMHDMNI